MSSNPVVRLLSLFLSLLLVACAAYQSQHGPRAGRDEQTAPPVVRPGGDFTALPDDGQIARIRGEVTEVKDRLATQGKYACCVQPYCSECLLKHGECHCRESLRKEGPCCGECTEAWIEGRGVVEGMTAWDVLERRKHILEESNRKKGGEEKPQPQDPPPHH